MGPGEWGELPELNCYTLSSTSSRFAFFYRGSHGYDIADLLFLVYDDQWRLHSQSKRVFRNHTHCTTVLEAGYYNIFCLSFTKWHDHSKCNFCLLHYHIDKEGKEGVLAIAYDPMRSNKVL